MAAVDLRSQAMAIKMQLKFARQGVDGKGGTAKAEGQPRGPGQARERDGVKGFFEATAKKMKSPGQREREPGKGGMGHHTGKGKG